MPGKTVIIEVTEAILQYGLLLLLYCFIFRMIKAIYLDLKIRDERQINPAGQPQISGEKARLQVEDSGSLQLAEQVFVIDDNISIGRSRHNDIVIDSSFVSHEHACINRYKNEFYLTDLNSTNKTYLNSDVLTGRALLGKGDIIKIGEVIFRFER